MSWNKRRIARTWYFVYEDEPFGQSTSPVPKCLTKSTHFIGDKSRRARLIGPAHQCLNRIDTKPRAQSANLEVAARRIVFSKNINAGQVCIAPDHVLVHQKVSMCA